MNYRFKADVTSVIILIVTLLSCLLQITSLLLYRLNLQEIPLYSQFTWQFYLLITSGFLFTVILYRTPHSTTAAILLVLKFVFVFLIGYPLGDNIEIELCLFLALVMEIAFYMPLWISTLMSSVFFLIFISSQSARSAWWQQFSSVSSEKLMVSGIFSLMVFILVIIIKTLFQKGMEKDRKISRLDMAVTRLSDANFGFQNYLKTIERKTLDFERKRVSREIHDTVGHALTSTIMLIEEAGINPGEKEGRELLALAGEQARKGLQETRTAMRHLRDEKVQIHQGIPAINDLVRAFEKATGISIEVEYGNMPNYTSESVDAVIFRIIQEGITNAFRHGMARKIRITFWKTSDTIKLNIHDNGSGASEIVEGIGMAGMKERLDSLGGRMKTGNVTDGFELSVEIPWKRNPTHEN